MPLLCVPRHDTEAPPAPSAKVGVAIDEDNFGPRSRMPRKDQLWEARFQLDPLLLCSVPASLFSSS